MEKPTPAEISYQEDHYTQSRAHPVLVVCVTCFTLASVAVFLRLLSRRMARSSMAKDDFMICVALVSRLFAFPCFAVRETASVS